MKLWSKGKKTADIVESFTVGNDRAWDLRLAVYDVKASRAHAKMLHHVGLISKEDVQAINKGLDLFLEEINKSGFEIEEDFEDIHSKLEYFLTEKIGEAGKKIHTARSRNDQVLVAMQLFLKDASLHFANKVADVSQLMLDLGAQYQEVLIPGYTHMQVAMPNSFGLWFGAYAESLIDDLFFLEAAYKIADQNPLGSAAGYGSSFPIDREMTTKAMDFKYMKVNVVAAQMGRGKVEKSLAIAIGNIASTVAKFAMDVCLYMGQNHGFLSFPDQFTTGSSIMPHKKNPDVFELIRGKCNRLQSIPNEISFLLSNLPSGYHREFQELKDILFPAMDTMEQCLDVILAVLPHIIIKPNIAQDKRYDFMYSVEVVNDEIQKGASFRDAYKTVGKQIEDGEYKPNYKINHQHIGSIGNPGFESIKKKLEAARKFGRQK